MYCKVCHDAGKTKEEFTSHFVKDQPGPEGKVVCPYLLGLSCRYCKESGHTIGHCQKLKAKDARKGETNTQRRPHRPRVMEEDDRKEFVRPKRTFRAPREHKTRARTETENVFNNFNKEETKETQKPCVAIASVKEPQLTGWAQVACKPATTPPPSPPPHPVNEHAVKKKINFTPWEKNPTPNGWEDDLSDFEDEPSRSAWSEDEDGRGGVVCCWD